MKEFKTSIIIAVLYIAISNITIAQNSISGKISDKNTHEYLPNATVFLPEQNMGTLSNENGDYEIKDLPNGKVKIQFSFMGYQTIIKTIELSNSNQSLNIELETAILQPEEVVISGGTYSTQHENAIKIELLKSKDINSLGTPTFIESLAKIPGVDMIANGLGVAKPVIRGLSMTNILMLNNGVKLENFQFSEHHPFVVDEFGIDRIEVIKGPASLLFGSDAVGGVLNIIKEKPAPHHKIIGDYNMQYHTNTQGIVSDLGIKGASNDLNWGFRGSIKSHTDYKDGDGNYVPNTRFNEQSFKTSLGLNKTFGIFRLYYDFNRPKLGMSSDESIPLITNNGRKNKYWYQDLTNHIISSKNTLFLNNYKVDVNLSYQMNNRRLQTEESNPAFEMVNMDLNTLSFEVKTYLPSSKKSDYIIGIQGAYKKNRNNKAPNHVIPDANVNDYSVFGLTQHHFIDKLETQIGLRYDYRSIDTYQETDKPALNKNYSNISISAGATYDANDHILLRANFASAYRTPNIAELTQNGVHETRYEQGNADLKSQRNYETDISAHYHTKFLMFDIAGFYNSITQYIYLAPTNETSAEGYQIFRYSQSDSHLYGGEFSLNSFITKWLNFTSTYSYLIGKQDNGEYLPFIPQNKIRGDFKIQKEKIGFLEGNYFQIGGLWASKQNHPAFFETKTNGYFLLNSSIGTQIKCQNQNIEFLIHVNNLLNEKYIDHLSTLKEVNLYNMGRNICFQLKIPFGIK